MITAIAIIVEMIGILFLFLGYRKSNRNMMLLGAVLLWVGAAIGDFLHGFFAGWTQVHNPPSP